ncbi:hypothetical protein AAFC00_001711 [Neodothiora populina]|uniref:Uncharacterized protein n=1 Tax=Neodothiora populina TaxID=2781224 RepID=A0ABR3PPW0_9PEZI
MAISPSYLLSSQPGGDPEPLSQLSEVASVSKNQRRYRPARPLPYELNQHCVTFIEEELYSQAFSLLLNLLLAGADIDDDDDDDNKQPLHAYVPSSQIIALAATLIVHPSVTNRARSQEQSQASNDALFYLNHLRALVGPACPHFAASFDFGATSQTRQGRRRTHQQDAHDEDDDHGSLRIGLANHASLWSAAEDFWQVVGWAFNTSTCFPERWERWKLWLTFMLDVMEDDLEASISASESQADSESKNEKLRSASDSSTSSTLLAVYLRTAGEGRTGKRKIMRAILADGTKKNTAGFGEVWKNETKGVNLPKEEFTSKRQRLNVAEGDFGDYLDVDDDDDDEGQDEKSNTLAPPLQSASATRKRTLSDSSPTKTDAADASTSTSNEFGGIESILLRQRFMALLVKLSSYDRSAFLDTDSLLDLYTESLRPLPLRIFVQFTLPTTPYLEPHAQATLNQTLLQPLISSDAPTFKAMTMTQEAFEKHYLPFPSNYASLIENARVSILIEGLLRLLLRHLDLQISVSLKRNLELGIQARRDKAAGSGTRRKRVERGVEDQHAAEVLEMSAARMRLLLVLIEQ